MTYLGIDLGTSGVKAMLIDAEQSILGAAQEPLEVSRPRSGWSEQDPDAWIEATGTALAHLRQTHGAELAATRGIGLSGQMHGATLLDDEDRPIRPCLLWNDTRAHAEAAEMDADPRFREISGNIVFPGFTAPKVEWVRRNEPEQFARLSRILLPKDYLRLWLTGENVSDMSDASGTSWLDVGGRRWSPDLLAACQLDESRMPSLVEGSAGSGGLRGEIAAQFGMRPNIVVAGGGGDNAASAIGMGTVRAGSAFLSLGTSGVLFAATDRFAPRPESAVHAFCHALPDKWHQMGVILSATDALNWYGKLVGCEPAQLVDELDEGDSGPSRVLFLPYLAGERTPHNDAGIRSAFLGMEHASGRKELTRAVLDGVAYALRDNLAALEQAGTRLQSVLAVGGGSRSALWLQRIADILEVEVQAPADGDFGAAFGAARLGMLAAENGDWSRICQPPAIAKVYHPRPDWTAAHAQNHARFMKFYRQIKDI